MAVSPIRRLRRRLTSSITHTACDAAPFLPSPVISLAEQCIRLAGPMAPVLAKIIRENMRAAGVYSPTVLRAYFREAALHLSNGVRVFHFRRRPGEVRRIASAEIALDASVVRAADLIRERGGGIVAPAHCTNYLVSLVKLKDVIPISIYLRWSKDQRKVDLKRAWCEAAGLDVIIEPKDAANPVGSAMVCAEAIREGRILAITPDLPQERETGTPVRVLDRMMFLPAGPASLAMLCNVPLIPMYARAEGRMQCLFCEDAIEVPMLSRSEGGRKESIRRAMQVWADGFTRFVQNAPHLWFLWGDNRWTRVFQGDIEYTGACNREPPAD